MGNRRWEGAERTDFHLGQEGRRGRLRAVAGSPVTGWPEEQVLREQRMSRVPPAPLLCWALVLRPHLAHVKTRPMNSSSPAMCP